MSNMESWVEFFPSGRRHTGWNCDWSSDVCSSDLEGARAPGRLHEDLAASVAGCGVVREIGPGVLLAVRRHELPGARVLAGNGNEPARPQRDQLRLPRARAVDELRGSPQNLVEPREGPA